jgi:succinylglutamic semialdehyde dehydrogenase
VIRVDDFDQAIAEANNTRFGLSASLIGGTPEDYNRFWANIRAGIINWNRPTNGLPARRPVRRDRLFGQSPPGRLLRGRLLRLSGRQHRDGGQPRP